MLLSDAVPSCYGVLEDLTLVLVNLVAPGRGGYLLVTRLRSLPQNLPVYAVAHFSKIYTSYYGTCFSQIIIHTRTAGRGEDRFASIIVPFTTRRDSIGFVGYLHCAPTVSNTK
jgi:hypothetical protein